VLSHVRDADLIHVHAIDFFFDFLAFTRPLHRRRMIASTHGGFFHSAQFSVAKKLWFSTVTRASICAYQRIIACSHSDAELFQSRAGRRLTLIQNGIDQARLANAAAPAQTRTIICFGRFAQHKRVGALFPLLAQLRTQDPAWRLIVAGRDADQTAGELAALAAAEHVADAVRFVVNPSDTELRTLIGEASYFACLSAYEGFGLAAVEAMSAGLFPILSDIAPFRHLIDDTKIGLSLDPAAPAAMAARVTASILEDTAAYAARRAQIMHAVRSYDWEEVAAQYSEIYHDTVEVRPSTAPAVGKRVARLKP
jgi:alpha-1,3-mannosyltransferase